MGKQFRLAVVVLLLLLPVVSRAEVSIPDPGTYVVDRAEIIDAGTERQLEGWLRELERKTTAQVKVLTVESTQGEPFFSFVQRHADAWQLGRKGKDNGALIALALKERKVRIHTGYGLEGVLPDSWAGSASRAVASQFFKQARYSQGLFQLAVVTANRVADAQQVKLTGIPQHRYRPSRGGGSMLGSLLVPLFFLFVLLSSMRRRRRYYSTWGGGGPGRGPVARERLGEHDGKRPRVARRVRRRIRGRVRRLVRGRRRLRRGWRRRELVVILTGTSPPWFVPCQQSVDAATDGNQMDKERGKT